MKATAQAGSNIAFVKYWGTLDPELHLPLNSSISLTLDQANTLVTIEFSPHVSEGQDQIVLEGQPAEGRLRRRVVHFLDHLRRLAGTDQPARVATRSTFPVATGLAASASLFAGLTVAGLAALGLSMTEREMTTSSPRVLVT